MACRVQHSATVSVVVPAHNEEGILASALGQLIVDLDQMELGFEVILAENGSTDSTLQLAEGMAMTDRRLRVLHLEQPDYGRALRQGFLASSGVYLANFSVDFMDIDFLQTALSKLERHDLVLGSKYVAKSHDARPVTRRLGGRMLSCFAQTLFHLPVSDTHGLMAMRREVVLPLVKASQLGNEVFDTELIVRAHRAGIPMCEVPVSVKEVRPNRLGVVKRTVRMVVQLTWLRLVLWREGMS